MPATIRQTNQLRRELLSLALRSNRYPFISTVEDYLAQVPDDHQIRSLAVKELAEKGLWTVAVELGSSN